MKSNRTDSFYNVGTGIRTSLKELAELIVELTGCEKEITYKESSQATLVKNRIDSQKASEEINFTYSLELKEGLKKLIEWRNKHKATI